MEKSNSLFNILNKISNKIFFIGLIAAVVVLYQNCADDFNADAYKSSPSAGDGGGSTGGDNNPPPPPPMDTLTATGNRMSCALKNSTVYCWGLNSNGQLGDGTLISRSTPMPVNFATQGNPPIKQIAAGKNHVCAVSNVGDVYCWGSNTSGQLGVNLSSAQLAQSLTPLRVANLTNIVIEEVTAGQHFSCARTNTGLVYCWGTDQAGQLGTNATATLSLAPLLVQGLSNITQIASSFSTTSTTNALGRTCAVNNLGSLYCWGAFYNTQGTLTFAGLPAIITGISNVRSVSVSASFVCALRTTNNVQCFGHNLYGQLGLGSASNTYTVSGGAFVGNLSNVSAISTGDYHACAVHDGGLLSCWGRNQTLQGTNSAQLGQNPIQIPLSATPLLLSGQLSVRTIAAGDAHNCLTLTSGTVRCFGYNSNLQLGYTPPVGQTNPAFLITPADVVLP